MRAVVITRPGPPDVLEVRDWPDPEPREGEVRIRTVEAPPGIEIVVSDQGPGIADIEQAMHAGFTSGAGLGMGLPGTRRLMDYMDIQSALGQGTTIVIRKYRR